MCRAIRVRAPRRPSKYFKQINLNRVSIRDCINKHTTNFRYAISVLENAEEEEEEDREVVQNDTARRIKITALRLLIKVSESKFNAQQLKRCK